MTSGGLVSQSCANLAFGDPSTCNADGIQLTGQHQDNATGLDNFKARYYSPVIGQFMTPDPGAPSAPARWGGGPAGLAAVDPNNPQTWNRYAYVGGNPLSRIDPLGLQPCNTAALRRPGSDQEADGFGPYSPDEDGAAAQADGDCGAFWNQCSLDGVSMDCDLMQEMDGMSGGGGGESIDWGASSACNWYACPPTVPGQDGNPHQLQWRWVNDHDPNAPCNAGMVGCTGIKGGYKWVDVGPAESCGALNFGCQFFSGFVNFFLNDRISGLGQMALGEVGAAGAALGGTGASATAGAIGDAMADLAIGIGRGAVAISTGLGIAGAGAAAYSTNPALFTAVQQYGQAALSPVSAAWTYAGGTGVATRDVAAYWDALFGGPW